MTAPRAPANRAELIEVMARAIAWAALTPHGRTTCVWPDSFSDGECLAFRHGAGISLAALEAAGVRLVPVEPLERQLVGGMIRPDYYRALAASPYAPEGK